MAASHPCPPSGPAAGPAASPAAAVAPAKKPVSARKLAANRANARKSTGPRTAEGIRRAALNAVKHGLTAQTSVLPGEDPEKLAELKAEMMSHFPAANPFEASVVSRLIDINWRLTRAARAEESVANGEYTPRANVWSEKLIYALGQADPMWQTFLNPGDCPLPRGGHEVMADIGSAEGRSMDHICRQKNRLHNQMMSAIRAWVSLRKLPPHERPADAAVVTKEDVLKERHRPPPPLMSAEQEQLRQAMPELIAAEAAAARAELAARRKAERDAEEALERAEDAEDAEDRADRSDDTAPESSQPAAAASGPPLAAQQAPTTQRTSATKGTSSAKNSYGSTVASIPVRPAGNWKDRPVNWRAGLAQAAQSAVAGKVEAALGPAVNPAATADGDTKIANAVDDTEPTHVPRAASPVQNGPTAGPPPKA